jgi:hypothetical protein
VKGESSMRFEVMGDGAALQAASFFVLTFRTQNPFFREVNCNCGKVNEKSEMTFATSFPNAVPKRSFLRHRSLGNTIYF